MEVRPVAPPGRLPHGLSQGRSGSASPAAGAAGAGTRRGWPRRLFAALAALAAGCPRPLLPHHDRGLLQAAFAFAPADDNGWEGAAHVRQDCQDGGMAVECSAGGLGATLADFAGEGLHNATLALRSTGLAMQGVARRAAGGLPEAVQDSWRELKFACRRAGGQSVVVGAAAAGGMGGLCVGAVLWTGEVKVPTRGNATRAIMRLRRSARRRLLLLAAGSAVGAGYLTLLPAPWEGGTGPLGQASASARRLGHAAAAFGRALRGPLPTRPELRPWVRV